MQTIISIFHMIIATNKRLYEHKIIKNRKLKSRIVFIFSIWLCIILPTYVMYILCDADRHHVDIDLQKKKKKQQTVALQSR